MAEDGESHRETASRPAGSGEVRYRHDRRESTFSLPVFLVSFVILLAVVAAVILATLLSRQEPPPPAPEPANTSDSTAAKSRAESLEAESVEQGAEAKIREDRSPGSEIGEVRNPEAGADSPPSSSAPPAGKEGATATVVEPADSVVGPATQRESGNRRGADREARAARDRFSFRGRRGPEVADNGEHWWLGPIGVTARLFLLDRRDESGERHLFRAAALGERFVFVEFSIAWRGENPRDCVIMPTGAKQPTVRLSSGREVFDPLGLVTGGAEPLRPFGPSTVKVEPREQVSMNLAFSVPEDLEEIELSAEGLQNLTLALPPAKGIEVGSLIGRWRRVDELYRPMRSGSSLIDAIGRPGGRIAQMSLGSRGSLRMELAGEGIAGRAAPAQPGTGASSSLSMTLVHNDERQPCVLRATQESRVLLLYAGDSQQTVFVYERTDP